MGQARHWDRPYNLLTVKGETCIVKLPSGPTSFQSTVVKPYLQLESTESNPEINLKPQELEVDKTTQSPIESRPQPL
jgi:hypothetical protein